MDESGPSREDLLRLRHFVQRARAEGRSAVPLPELVTLARDLGAGAGVTIDFEASETLGAPMVVVRPLAPAIRPPTAPPDATGPKTLRKPGGDSRVSRGPRGRGRVYTQKVDDTH